METFKNLIRVLNLMGDRKWKYIISIIICAAVDPIYQIGFAFANKFIFNAIAYQSQELLINGIALMAVIFIVYCVVQPIAGYHYEGKLYYPIIDIHMNLVSNIIKFPNTYFDKNHSGNVMSRLTSDLDKLSDFYREYTYDVVTHIILGLGSLISIFFIDIRFIPIMVILGVFAIGLNKLFGKEIYDLTSKIQSNTAKSNEWYTDMISGLRTIKVFGMEGRMFSYYKKSYNEVTKNAILLNDLNGKKNSMNFLLDVVNFVGILGIGVLMISYNMTDIGSVMAIIVLQKGVTSLFINMGTYIANFQSALVGAQRIFQLIDETKERDGEVSVNIGDQHEGVSLKDITFKYDGQQKNLFDKLNINFEKNKVSAIVGESGSGKSTIFKLLLGLYQDYSGEIGVLGNKTSECKLEEIREMIGYVPQTPYIFDASIYENIRYGRLDATEDEIIAAAKAANAHEFIENTPNKYHSYLGEGGINLSGGQYQRIELARVFLKNSPIILLDEVTSALDSESEDQIKQALQRLFKDRTVIAISHRISTIEDADQIFVLQDGRVVEIGSHEKLMDEEGVYYNFYGMGAGKLSVG